MKRLAFLILCSVMLSGPAYAQRINNNALMAAPALAPAAPFGMDGSVMQGLQNPTITAFRVDGAQRIEESTVLSYVRFKAGDSFDQARADRSLKDLFATGYFNDVSLNMDGAILVVKVAENPVINRIAFEGNSEIKSEDLEKEIQLRSRVVYTRSKVQTDVDRLLEVYRRSGRFAAKVEPKLIPLEQNRTDLVFEITEGPRTGVARIAFVGNEAFSDGDLRAEISTRESRWWRLLSSADFYDPDRTNFDRELLRRFYLNNGYADFRVLSAVAELNDTRDYFFMTFTMDEGARYKFGKVELESQLKDLNTDDLMQKLTMKSDDWYNASEVEASISALTKAAGDLQYAFVDIDPQVQRNEDSKTIDVKFLIKEGPRVFINRVNVSGNNRTEDRVIRREMLLVEADPFNASKIRRSEQRIKDLGFFENVKVTPKPTAQPDKADLEVEVQEKATGEISVGAGFSTTDGILGDISVRERNLLGKGQDLRVGTTFSQRSQQYDISFTEPYFLERDLSAGFDLFRTSRDNQTESSYDQKNNGGSLRLGYPLGEFLRQRVNYTLDKSEITNVPSTASRFIREQAGDTVTSSVGQELSYDRRDSKLEPTEGYILRYNTDFAGVGGDSRFLRNKLLGTWYTSPLKDVVLSLEGEVGYIFGIGGKDVRISERFYLGGESLRGFEFAGVGPRDLSTTARDALGGNRFLRSSAELAYPLGLPEELGFRTYTFVDAGSLSGLDTKPQPGEIFRDNSSMRLSAGQGLSWKSPFGPIRIDYAIPIIKEDYDREQKFRFSFGTRF